MRRYLILLVPFAFAAPAWSQEGDGPWHRDGHRHGFPGKFLVQRFLGDLTPEQKDALKAIRTEFIGEASQQIDILNKQRQTILERFTEARMVRQWNELFAEAANQPAGSWIQEVKA